MSGDRYKYFRIEARELLDVLSRGALELERGAGSRELVGRLLRAAHTLKGASRVVKLTEISTLAHAVEDALAPHREAPSGGSLPPAPGLLPIVDSIAAKLAALVPAEPPADRTSPPAGADERFHTVRVETADLDSVLGEVTDAAVAVASVRAAVEPLDRLQSLGRELRDWLDRPRDDGGRGTARMREIGEELETLLHRQRRSLEAALDRADREIAQVGDTVHGLRLLPARTLFASLERAVRDAAEALGKRAEFHPGGGDNRVDAHVLAALDQALLHVVRNAVAHGIESAAERAARGKPPAGRIALSVERTGNRLVFSCSDDGRGIDVEAVRRVAARRRLRPEPELAALGPGELAQLVLAGDMSTAAAPTEVSGRGIGLDVVRDTIARLRGDVAVRTAPGEGTTFSLSVPFSLTAVPALRVEAAGVTCCIPLDAIETALRVPPAAIARSGEGAALVHDGASVPFIPLAAALGRAARAGLDRDWSAVVVRGAGRTAAIGVDRMLGTTNIVLTPLPPWIGAEPVVAGATVDASGQPWLVLDPPALTGSARRDWHVRTTAPAPLDPILVVDDSLTTRMLEQTILQSAGYDVDTATSAEEALDKARDRRYSLLVVDVEMPGMDGFELLARAQVTPALRDVPAMLVTSRDSAEDRRRGQALGARAYVVKQEFDQRALLDIVSRLVGER